MPRPPMKKPSAARVQQDALPEERCYLCDAAVGRTDEVVRVHEPRCTAAVTSRTFAAGARRATGVRDV